MKLLLKNGRLFDGIRLADDRSAVLVEDGVIRTIGKDLPEDGAEVMDLEGRILCPGFIDLHAHFRDPGYEWRG
ncbi:MAG TPA: dihydroorotase, partial [Synergistaceae bacterium]|nr:dihydroorotase [Synergistaceae bacterium]